MTTNDNISKNLGIRPIEEAQEEANKLNEEDQQENALIEGDVKDVAHPPAIPENKEHEKDIELARQNVQNIIEMGDDAVKEMVEIAKQSESPRAFEVVSTLMKTLLDANKDFVDLSNKKKFEKEAQPTRNETNVTNNNLIVSTADLLKMIKGEKDV